MAEINKLSVGQAIDKLRGRLSASMLVICRSQKKRDGEKPSEFWW
jgi:hypothetical protein